ncbi:hypothetical protein [Desulfovibrio inopinatus]|uniref:hypothetical protein n=1 Tax=Desulfovibrio inopinatus TaxID=102109 RepID=UPI0004849FD9|nr:hypothetical protein [Desulfovibrio inopinatus]
MNDGVRQFLLAVNHRRRLVIGIVVSGFICGVLLAWSLPVQYQSSASLRSMDTPVMDDMLKDMLSTLPLSIDLQKHDSTQDIVAFLQSRTLRQRLIDGLDLLPRLYPMRYHPLLVGLLRLSAPTTVLALQENALDAVLTVTAEADGLIHLDFLDRDPMFAAAVLRRVIDELRYYLETEHDTDAKRERVFIEHRLADVEAELHRWETATPSTHVPLGQINRELTANQTVYAELKRRLALAQIAESRQTIAFKVLDPPLIPVKRARPRRILLVSFCVLASLLVAAMVVSGLVLRDEMRQHTVSSHNAHDGT